MRFYYKHLLPFKSIEEIKTLIKALKELNYEGVFFPFYNSGELDKGTGRTQYFPIAQVYEIVKEAGLKIGTYVPCFMSRRLWNKEDFSPPVNYTGSPAMASQFYYPVCPNNPMGFDLYRRILERLYKLPELDFYLLEHIRFPFDWENEDLDIQYSLPKYCYCPFCVTEFSSLMGEVFTSAGQIMEYIEDWLEWRSQVVVNLISIAKEALANKGRIIISVPPLALIDLPFATGQLPKVIGDLGCYVAPKLYHKSREGNFLWIEDLLDQYLIELNVNKIFLQVHISSEKDYEAILNIYKKYNPIGVLVSIFADS